MADIGSLKWYTHTQKKNKWWRMVIILNKYTINIKGIPKWNQSLKKTYQSFNHFAFITYKDIL